MTITWEQAKTKTRHCTLCGNPAFMSLYGEPLCWQHFFLVSAALFLPIVCLGLLLIQQAHAIGFIYRMLLQIGVSPGDALIFVVVATLCMVATWLISFFYIKNR